VGLLCGLAKRSQVSSAITKAVTFSTRGDDIEPRTLSCEDVVAVHEALVADFAGTQDPISPPGISGMTLLESAVSRQHNTRPFTPVDVGEPSSTGVDTLGRWFRAWPQEPPD